MDEFIINIKSPNIHAVFFSLTFYGNYLFSWPFKSEREQTVTDKSIIKGSGLLSAGKKDKKRQRQTNIFPGQKREKESNRKSIAPLKIF